MGRRGWDIPHLFVCYCVGADVSFYKGCMPCQERCLPGQERCLPGAGWLAGLSDCLAGWLAGIECMPTWVLAMLERVLLMLEVVLTKDCLPCWEGCLPC